MKTKEALIEGLKEFARVAVLAAIPLLVSGLQSNEPTIDWRLIGITAIIAGLKALDKFVYKNDDIPAKGLTQF